jgi:hypothetical protein
MGFRLPKQKYKRISNVQLLPSAPTCHKPMLVAAAFVSRMMCPSTKSSFKTIVRDYRNEYLVICAKCFYESKLPIYQSMLIFIKKDYTFSFKTKLNFHFVIFVHIKYCTTTIFVLFLIFISISLGFFHEFYY